MKLTYTFENSINVLFDFLNTFEEGIRDIEFLPDLFVLREKLETFSSAIKATVGAIENLEKRKGR